MPNQGTISVSVSRDWREPRNIWLSIAGVLGENRREHYPNTIPELQVSFCVMTPCILIGGLCMKFQTYMLPSFFKEPFASKKLKTAYQNIRCHTCQKILFSTLNNQFIGSIYVCTRCNWKVRTNFWARVPQTETRKNVHINMCPETFNLWLIAERIPCRHHRQFSVNVRTEIVGEWYIRPHVLPHRHTGNHYRDFLSHEMPKLLEAVPQTIRARMSYMRDSAPAQFSRAVPIMTDGYVERTHCMTSTLHATFESSGYLPKKTPRPRHSSGG
jgi:phage FluMu protein Com